MTNVYPDTEYLWMSFRYGAGATDFYVTKEFSFSNSGLTLTASPLSKSKSRTSMLTFSVSGIPINLASGGKVLVIEFG